MEPVLAASKAAWAGRISLRVEAEPVQFFSAGFELAGSHSAGLLVLTSPLGNVLGTLRWSAEGALLDRGNGQPPERFASVDDMLLHTTGAELPLAALFGWLAGTEVTAPGWQADVSRRNEGRVVARRLLPLPQAELRIALEP